MRKIILIFSGTILSLMLLAQGTSHGTLTINIEVPVGAFEWNTFFNIKAIGDFEFYKSDRLQKMETIYFEKKMNIKRKQESELANNQEKLKEILKKTKNDKKSLHYENAKVRGKSPL